MDDQKLHVRPLFLYLWILVAQFPQNAAGLRTAFEGGRNGSVTTSERGVKPGQ